MTEISPDTTVHTVTDGSPVTPAIQLTFDIADLTCRYTNNQIRSFGVNGLGATMSNLLNFSVDALYNSTMSIDSDGKWVLEHIGHRHKLLRQSCIQATAVIKSINRQKW